MTDMTLVSQFISIMIAILALLSALGLSILITLLCKYYLFK